MSVKISKISFHIIRLYKWLCVLPQNDTVQAFDVNSSFLLWMPTWAFHTLCKNVNQLHCKAQGLLHGNFFYKRSNLDHNAYGRTIATHKHCCHDCYRNWWSLSHKKTSLDLYMIGILNVLHREVPTNSQSFKTFQQCAYPGLSQKTKHKLIILCFAAL